MTSSPLDDALVCMNSGVEGSVRVLVAVRDVRVRRALSGLLELDGHRLVAETDVSGLGAELDGGLVPDLVVLELDLREVQRDLRVIQELVRRGPAVIAVVSGRASCAAVLAAGARACVDKDAHFTDRFAEAVRAVSGPGMPAPPA